MDVDQLFERAVQVARNSPNRQRKVGAVLILPDGGTEIEACNTYPDGVQDIEERHQGDGRLIWMEHAERNAIFKAARCGVATRGATLFSTYFPCADCARAIVQVGIARVYTLAADLSDPVWGRGFAASQVILQEGGVDVVILDRDLPTIHARTLGLVD